MESITTTMVGRESEQALLSALVTAAAGEALVLRGETGVGKTSLLNHAIALAEQEGQAVVRATGVEAEAELPYAGLHQLLYPFLEDVEQLDDRTAAVFDAVLGRAEGEPPSVMALGIAVLSLLSTAAARRPLLLVVDDGQWLDCASADVCGFVGRRLAGSRVTLLVAVRADIASRFDTSALPERLIAPLPDKDASLLLDQRFPALTGSARRTLLEQGQGNPLALLELPAYLAAEPVHQSGDEFNQHGVPLPRRLQHLYGARIRALDEKVRAELLMGALDGVGTRSGDGEAVVQRYRMCDADEAVAVGLLDVEPATGDFVFRHPLVRSSVMRMATPNQRRAAHEALARAHRGNLERRATHLAAATVDPDEEVADVLESAAESAIRRGGAIAAVAWLTRAAELSEDHADRSRRLSDAAFVAGHAARLGQAGRLVLTDVGTGPGDSPAAALASAQSALYQHGDVRFSLRQVTAAIERLRDGGVAGHGKDLNRLVNLLLAIGQYAGETGVWESAHQLLDSLGDAVTERSRIYSNTWSDVVRHGAGWAEPVARATADLSELEPWEAVCLAAAAYHLDLLGDYRPYLQHVVGRELETGAVASGMAMLHLIMLDQIAAGEWDEAERTGLRALEVAAEHGYELFAMQSRGYLAQLAAMRGEAGRARVLQAEVDAWARPRGVGFLTQIADSAAVVAALSSGDYEAAYLYAIGITPPGTFRAYSHQASRILLDMVEAALHTGRVEQARQHALAARDAGLPDVSPRLAVITYGVLSMTAENEKEAAEMFAAAETHPDAARFAFELARIRLAYGVRTRHVQGRTSARRLLGQAAEAFERLGAAGWAERAQAEMRATGVVPRGSTLNLASLTWQERRIADLAASGLTNKEIGKRMHLSPRTVSSHLYRAFPKLGISTRAALRDALRRTEEVLPV